MSAEVHIPEVIRPSQVMAYQPGDQLIGRQDLRGLPVPEPTRTHAPIAHADIVETLIQSLAFRNIEVVADQYAISKDAMKMFGVMTLNMEQSDTRLALGIRNANDKSFSLAITVGFRVIVCSNLMFSGDFSAIVAKKHSPSLVLEDTIALAVERMQRGFEPMGKKIDAWKGHSLSDKDAKSIIYTAFIEDGLPVPKHLARSVHNAYFEPPYPEFEERSMWSLQNAFTHAFKELEPIKSIPLAAKLGGFLDRWN